jgi:SAM-dependent methyltransferase
MTSVSHIAETRTTAWSCPACSGQSERLFEVSGYWVRRCEACEHLFAELPPAEGHVERNYGEDYFTGGGAGYRDYLSEEPLLVARGRWYARLMSKHCRPGEVLDIGAAAGFTLAGFRESGWKACGIEPNASMAKHAQDRFGLDVEQASLEAWNTSRRFDLLTMLQVLPHFVDPRGALERGADFVRPGGHLLVETWNRESWTARALGKHWHEFNPPTVLHWFSKNGLARLASSAGFTRIAQGRPSKWITAGHAKSILRHKGQTSFVSRVALAAAAVVPDRVAIPYPSEDLFWMLLKRD